MLSLPRQRCCTSKLPLSQKLLYNSLTSLVSVIQEGSRAIAEAQTTQPNLDLPHLILHQVLGLTGAERAALFLLDDQGEPQLAAESIPSPPQAGGLRGCIGKIGIQTASPRASWYERPGSSPG
jgi:hypothetical protein